jgi:hypothetical protein
MKEGAMSKSSLCLSKIIFPVLVAFNATADAVSLVNGGAEAGSLLGWTADESGASSGNTGMIAAVTSTQGTVAPFAGNFFFSFVEERTCIQSNCGDVISLSQTGSLAMTTQPRLVLDGYVQVENRTSIGFGFDIGEAKLSIFGDPSGTVLLASTSTGDLVTPNRTWESFAISLPIPDGASLWRVDLLGKVADSNYADVFYDELSLRTVPIPAAIWMFGCALGALGIVGLKKRRVA